MTRPDRVLVFIPAYRCERQIPRVLAQFDAATQALVEEVVVVDNRSPDATAAAAADGLRRLTGVRTTLLRNHENYGLGGSHKVAFDYALDRGMDYVVVLHGDDQGSIADLVPHLRSGAHRGRDCLLGARFMRGSRLEGYSRFRTLGNHAFNALYSAVSRRRLSDLGSGLNLYSTRYLADRDYLRYANDLTFNYYAILAAVAKRADFAFFPLTWREDDQVSNVKLYRQARKTLRLLAQFAWSRRRFMAADHSGRPGLTYGADVIQRIEPTELRPGDVAA